DPVLDAQLLHRLQVQVDAVHLCRALPEPLDHLGRAAVALAVRPEFDQQAAAVEGGVVAVHADERRQRGHVRILQERSGQRPLPSSRAARGLSGWIASGAPLSRSPCGLSSLSRRPLLRVALLPSTPMNDDSEATSGSSRIAAASACWRRAMASNEIDCGVWLM